MTACDQLHASCLDDAAWQGLNAHFSDDAILEILMLAGRYRMVAYLTVALRMPLEAVARRFPPEAGEPNCPPLDAPAAGKSPSPENL